MTHGCRLYSRGIKGIMFPPLHLFPLFFLYTRWPLSQPRAAAWGVSWAVCARGSTTYCMLTIFGHDIRVSVLPKDPQFLICHSIGTILKTAVWAWKEQPDSGIPRNTCDSSRRVSLLHLVHHLVPIPLASRRLFDTNFDRLPVLTAADGREKKGLEYPKSWVW